MRKVFTRARFPLYILHTVSWDVRRVSGVQQTSYAVEQVFSQEAALLHKGTAFHGCHVHVDVRGEWVGGEFPVRGDDGHLAFLEGCVQEGCVATGLPATGT